MDEEVSQHSGADADSEFTLAKSPRSVISEEDTLHGGGATGDSSSTATTAGGGGSAVAPTSLFPTDSASVVITAAPAVTSMNVRLRLLSLTFSFTIFSLSFVGASGGQKVKGRKCNLPATP